MRSRGVILSGLLTAAVLLCGPRVARAQGYEQHNLVSNGPIPADFVDGDLVNAWGLAANAASPWWVADNETDKSTLYDATGTKRSLIVDVPGAPTGLVANLTSSFPVNGTKALFIFATEQGTVRAWNPSVGTSSFLAADNSTHGAVYKGATIASTAHGDFLYLTNFRQGRVDVYDGQWQPVSMPFRDPSLPHGYAPFGIRAIQNVILVTYALQDEDKEDDVPGPGHGFVDAYDHFGRLLARVASGGVLNSPWGLALAPADFGKFSSRLLIGNFGNGRIHAFGLMPHATSIGALTSCDGHPLVIDGLWAIDFGNDAAAGPHSTLYFTAGPDDEENGLFGSIAASTCSHRMGTH